ncbi:MAG: hypothetical protein LBU09_00460 [Endomicrobium sp.]|jgi:hypothetical protein|nr:hypothetical protein [Endomicrobium sp.]
MRIYFDIFFSRITAFILTFCIVVVYCAAFPKFLYAAQERQNETLGFDISYNIGNFGSNMLFKNDQNVYAFSLAAANLYIDDIRRGFGLKLSPFHFMVKLENTNETVKFSLLNADISWNPFPKSRKTAMMSPFVSINYLIYNDRGTLDMSDFIFSTGWRFAYVGRGQSRLRYDTYAEMGYRYFDNENYYYCTLSVDIIIAALIYLLSLSWT